DDAAAAATLGRNGGADLAQGKPTLPLIHAMRTGTPAEAELIAEALRQGDTSKRDEILTIVQQTGAMTYTLECAKQQVAEEQARLRLLPAKRYTPSTAQYGALA